MADAPVTAVALDSVVATSTTTRAKTRDEYKKLFGSD